MDRESQPTTATLIDELKDKLPYINFYRFCQLLEKSHPERPGLGSQGHLQSDPIRFRPHPGMGFPVSELKNLSPEDEYRHSQIPSIRTTFMGLYGVMSPLPTGYLDDIAQSREGSEAVTDFLDIFNHRLTTQFYRVWRKYSYPATFESEGKDETSQYLFGLIGLGIPGCAEHVETPISRFLALLGTMRLPTRTAEGISSLVKLLAPNTQVHIYPHDPRRIPLDAPTAMSCKVPTSLHHKPVLGRSAVDVNSQVLIALKTEDREEAANWLPEGQLHHDLYALLHIYLGSRVNARLQLSVPRSLLADAKLSIHSRQGGQLGRTAVMRIPQQGAVQNNDRQNNNIDDHTIITIGLGRYQAVAKQYRPQEMEEYGNYQF